MGQTDISSFSSRKVNRILKVRRRAMETEVEHSASYMSRLVHLADVIDMEQTFKLNIGPMSRIHQQVLALHNQADNPLHQTSNGFPE